MKQVSGAFCTASCGSDAVCFEFHSFFDPFESFFKKLYDAMERAHIIAFRHPGKYLVRHPVCRQALTNDARRRLTQVKMLYDPNDVFDRGDVKFCGEMYDTNLAV